jgi:hypothetical protein
LSVAVSFLVVLLLVLVLVLVLLLVGSVRNMGRLAFISTVRCCCPMQKICQGPSIQGGFLLAQALPPFLLLLLLLLMLLSC